MAAAAAAAASRREYLGQAVRAVAASSPSVAAHIQCTIDQPSTASTASPGRERYCNACGNLLLPALTCRRVVTRPGGAKSTRPRPRSIIRLECDRCSSTTTVREAERPTEKAQHPTAAPKRPPPSGADRVSSGDAATQSAQSAQSAQSTQSAQSAPAHSPAAVKKRSRGKKSSLQALLADRKPTTTTSSPGFGLSLDDFLIK